MNTVSVDSMTVSCGASTVTLISDAPGEIATKFTIKMKGWQDQFFCADTDALKALNAILTKKRDIQS